MVGALQFGPATIALMDVNTHSTFEGAWANAPLIITGGAEYGFLISTQSTVVTPAGQQHWIYNNPNFPYGFIDAIDGSLFNGGAGSSWIGSATGYKYNISVNSMIDNEQASVTTLPGSILGLSAYNSSAYPP